MAKRRSPTILFFTSNAKPTEQEYALADQLGQGVKFRNGRIARGLKREATDGVAALEGKLIPVAYAEDNVPRVKSADDVAKLKPQFQHAIGYADDDTGYAGPNASDIKVPGTDNEPDIGTLVGDDANTAAAAEATRLAAEALAAEEAEKLATAAALAAAGTGAPSLPFAPIPDGHEAVLDAEGKPTGETRPKAPATPLATAPATPPAAAPKVKAEKPAAAAAAAPATPPAWGAPAAGGAKTT